MQGNKLDKTDIQILETLQKQARTKRGQLAENAGLSIPTISERLHKLEENKVISGYHTVLDATRIGLGVTAFIFLTSESSTFYEGIIEQAVRMPQILEIHAITGDGSHLIKARVTNTMDLERLLSEIQSWPGVKNTRTDVVLSTAKETTEVSLEHLKADAK